VKYRPASANAPTPARGLAGDNLASQTF